DDAIPPISAEDDPELDRPLESIAEFERRQAAERAADASSDGDGAPSVDGTPVPALADGDAVEAIGDAPITDSELAAPLPALENFNVEPVEFAEPEEADAHRTIEYTVQVNGLAGADATT